MKDKNATQAGRAHRDVSVHRRCHIYYRDSVEQIIKSFYRLPSALKTDARDYFKTVLVSEACSRICEKFGYRKGGAMKFLTCLGDLGVISFAVNNRGKETGYLFIRDTEMTGKALDAIYCGKDGKKRRQKRR